MVELGCGPGFCSVAAALCGAADVVATDGDEKSVSLAALNLQNNCPHCILPDTTARAMKLYWGDNNDLQALHCSWRELKSVTSQSTYEGIAFGNKMKADFIIASDVAGCPYVSAYRSLLDTLQELCGPETVVLLACQKRHSSESAFYEMLKERFSVERYHELCCCNYAQTIHALYSAVSRLSLILTSMVCYRLSRSTIHSDFKHLPLFILRATLK